jgi:plastocyanin
MIRRAADHDDAVMRHAILAALLGAALVAGCGGNDDSAALEKTTTGANAAPAEDAEQTDTIKIVDFAYDPTPATVRAGQKISIPNADAAPHTITDTASNIAFDSGTIKGKATGSLTIDKPGTYAYICEFHPFMKGEVTVTK